MDKKTIKEHLLKTFCYKCGASLEGANIVPVSSALVTTTAHVTCPNCKAESMITVTLGGAGVLPIATDLMPEEIKNFFGAAPVNANDLLELHTLVKKGSLWKLLQKKEQNLEKKHKNSEQQKSSRE